MHRKRNKYYLVTIKFLINFVKSLNYLHYIIFRAIVVLLYYCYTYYYYYNDDCIVNATDLVAH